MMTRTDWARVFDRIMMLMIMLNIGVECVRRSEEERECVWDIRSLLPYTHHICHTTTGTVGSIEMACFVTNGWIAFR